MELTRPTSEGHAVQGGGVFATADGLSGFARIRVFPPLPWKYDFEKAILNKPPLTWIGAGMKFAVHDLPENGKPNKVLTKLTDIPLFARARTYFGTPDMANYTIEGDVMVVRDRGGQQRQGSPQDPRCRAHQQPICAGIEMRQQPVGGRIHVRVAGSPIPARRAAQPGPGRTRTA